jgi:glycosyltransferase involved in cell wall biosynthesis
MRIAIAAPPWFPIPPPRYGGIEWVVALLADGLVEAGHEVTLFATGDARTRAKVAASFPEARPLEIGRTWTELEHVLKGIARAGEFDVVNDHTGPLGAVLGGLAATVAGPWAGMVLGAGGMATATLWVGASPVPGLRRLEDAAVWSRP